MFFLFLPFNVFAECNTEELAKYKKLASNVNYSMEPVIVKDKDGNGDDYAKIYLTFTNLVDNLHIVNDYTFAVYKANNGIIKLDCADGGITAFSVRSSKCPDVKLMTFHIEFPQYNQYYNQDICKNYQSFPVCQKWVESAIYEDDIKNYIDKNTVKTEETINKKDVKGIFDYALDYYIKYYYIAVPATIVILVMIILIYKVYKRKKESLF